MAPELIKQSSYDFKADIWSLGITIYEMTTGNPPHVNVEPAKVIFLITRNAPPSLNDSFSKNLRDFLSLCLRDDPNEVILI